MRGLLAVVLAGILVAGCARPAAPPTGLARSDDHGETWTVVGGGAWEGRIIRGGGR